MFFGMGDKEVDDKECKDGSHVFLASNRAGMVSSAFQSIQHRIAKVPKFRRDHAIDKRRKDDKDLNLEN